MTNVLAVVTWISSGYCCQWLSAAPHLAAIIDQGRPIDYTNLGYKLCVFSQGRDAGRTQLKGSFVAASQVVTASTE
ncbi:hypothetical protein BJY52DRAFT_1256031 [Lactarius psammicola]|nr:hypothetical protein BJY52DRAFT_1256031 [Lactarius psammicola]